MMTTLWEHGLRHQFKLLLDTFGTNGDVCLGPRRVRSRPWSVKLDDQWAICGWLVHDTDDVDDFVLFGQIVEVDAVAGIESDHDSLRFAWVFISLSVLHHHYSRSAIDIKRVVGNFSEKNQFS